MLHVNDDMDDLFRQAAENYPLNANPDWDAVRKKMEAAAVPTKNNRPPYSNFLLTLFLILVPFKVLFNDIIQPVNNSGKTHSVVTTASASNDPNISLTKSAVIPSGAENNKTQTPGLIGAHSNYLSGNATAHSRVKRKRSGSGISSIITIGNAAQGEYDATASADVKIVSSAFETENNPAEIAEPATAKIETGIIEKKEISTAEKSDTTNPVSKNPTSTVTLKKIPNKKAAHFYAGIIGGPDLTSIKLQGVKKIGFSYGVVTGYRINNKWSIESGIIVDKKYYSTDGKYFSTKNLTIPNYVKIEHATGSCNMLEIPVSVRFSFPQKKGSWFAAAGLSSYLMKEEYYNYDIDRYGVRYTRDFTYNESRNSFISALSISGGYTRKLGNFDVRLEPYLKLPVKNVGIGNMHLQSAGVYIAITKFIF